MATVLTSTDLDNIEDAALGKARGLGVFAHPNDTLLLIKLIRVLEKENNELRAKLKLFERNPM